MVTITLCYCDTPNAYIFIVSKDILSTTLMTKCTHAKWLSYILCFAGNHFHFWKTWTHLKIHLLQKYQYLIPDWCQCSIPLMRMGKRPRHCLIPLPLVFVFVRVWLHFWFQDSFAEVFGRDAAAEARRSRETLSRWLLVGVALLMGVVLGVLIAKKQWRCCILSTAAQPV